MESGRQKRKENIIPRRKFRLVENSLNTVSKKPEHTEMACLLSWMLEKETLFSQGERLMKNNYY